MRDLQDRGYRLLDAPTRVDLVVCGTTEQRLYRLDQSEDAGELVRAAAVLPAGPRCEPGSDDGGRCTQKHDVVEAGQKKPHVRRAATHEQHAALLDGKQVAHGVLTPHPVATGLDRRSCCRGRIVNVDPLRVLGTVEIDGAVTARLQFRDEG